MCVCGGGGGGRATIKKEEEAVALSVRGRLLHDEEPGCQVRSWAVRGRAGSW